MRFVIKRVAISVLLLVATSVVIFVVLRALPGDPVTARLGTARGVNQEMIDRLRRSAGLDRPLISQYFSWVTGIFRGDLGKSYFTSRPVSSMLATALSPTLEITAVAVIFSMLLAVPGPRSITTRPISFAGK